MATTSVKIDYDALLNNPAAQIKITIPGQRPVVGFMQSELSIIGRNEHSTLFDLSAQQEASKKINQARSLAQTSGLAKLIGQETTGKLQNVSLINLSQTVEEWTASAKPLFNVTMMFVAMRYGQDVRIPVAKLLQATYPRTGSLGSFKGAFLKAPTGSDPSRSSFTTVEIGQWFIAPRQIVKSLNFTFSQQVVKLDPSGTKTAPLFCIAQIEFSPYRLITYNEIKQFIRMGGVDVRKKDFFKIENVRLGESVKQEEGSGGILNAIKAGINIPGIDF